MRVPPPRGTRAWSIYTAASNLRQYGAITSLRSWPRNPHPDIWAPGLWIEVADRAAAAPKILAEAEDNERSVPRVARLKYEPWIAIVILRAEERNYKFRLPRAVMRYDAWRTMLVGSPDPELAFVIPSKGIVTTAGRRIVLFSVLDLAFAAKRQIARVLADRKARGEGPTDWQREIRLPDGKL